MRSIVSMTVLVLLLPLHASAPGFAAPVAHTDAPPATHARPCGQGFRCENVHVQLCTRRPHGRSIWSLSRKDVALRRGVSVRGCTEYAVGIGFTLRYNGRLATLPQHAPTCVVQAERTVRILIRTCYATVQRTNKAQFRDLVAGARICVRSIEFHGPGCHDDFALNVYAYRNGTLVGDTFVGFTLRVPNV